MRRWLVGSAFLVALGGCGDAPLVPPEPPAVPDPQVGALTVLRSFPPDGATGVARAAQITVVFSEPVQPPTVNAGSVALWKGAEPVAADLAVDSLLATLTPRTLLELNAVYALTVSRDVRDTAGRPMIREYRAVFATKVNRSP